MTVDVNKLKCLYFDLVFKLHSKDYYGYLCSVVELELIDTLEKYIFLLEHMDECTIDEDVWCEIKEFYSNTFRNMYTCKVNKCINIININCDIVVVEELPPVKNCTAEQKKIHIV